MYIITNLQVIGINGKKYQQWHKLIAVRTLLTHP